jgi:hypothetical protein
MNSKHAPTHLREEFQEWLDSYETDRLHEIDIRPVAGLLEALEDCGDILPAGYCDQLEILKGSTYAQAVADVRQWAARQKAAKDDSDVGDPNPSAREVYLEYVKKAGEEACDELVVEYYDPHFVADILLEHMDADELEEYLKMNLLEDQG